jgi:hypothetical protein
MKLTRGILLLLLLVFIVVSQYLLSETHLPSQLRSPHGSHIDITDERKRKFLNIGGYPAAKH